MQFCRTLIVSTLAFPVAVFCQQELKVALNSQKFPNHQFSYERVAPNRIKVVVTDSGKAIGGLQVNDFEIWAGKSSVEILSVQPILNSKIANVSMLLCIDNSGSMLNYVDFLLSTLNELLDSVGPSVKISTAFFTNEPNLSQDFPFDVPEHIRIFDFTTERTILRKAFREYLKEKLINYTYLYDEVYAAIKMMETVSDPQQKRFIIILSDGIDNGSRNNEAIVEFLVEQNPGVVIYAIDYLKDSSAFLQNLAALTNGKHFQARRVDELAEIFENITQDIVNLSGYLLTFSVPEAVVTGRVIKARSCAPVENAEIVFACNDLPERVVRIKTGRNGKYKINLPVPYDWFARVDVSGFDRDSTIIHVAEKDVYFVDFNLNKAVLNFEGHITDYNKTPVSYAKVKVVSTDDGTILFDAIADSSGEYHFTSSPGQNILVTATADSFTYNSIILKDVSQSGALPVIKIGATTRGMASEFRLAFVQDSVEIDTSDVITQMQLRDCVEFIKKELAKDPARKVRLVGWTDSLSVAIQGKDFTRQQAESVKNYLAKHDIKLTRILIDGWGVNYKYDNSTEVGREMNRRIDVIFLEPRSVSEK